MLTFDNDINAIFLKKQVSETPGVCHVFSVTVSKEGQVEQLLDILIFLACNVKAIQLNVINCLNNNGMRVAFQRKFHRNALIQAKNVLIVYFITKNMDMQQYLDQVVAQVLN